MCGLIENESDAPFFVKDLGRGSKDDSTNKQFKMNNQ